MHDPRAGDASCRSRLQSYDMAILRLASDLEDHCGDARACDGGCDARTYDWGSALYPPRSDGASHGGGGTGAPLALCGPGAEG